MPSPIKERAILFSAPMVRAILEGRKTQTRRVCKPLCEFEKSGSIDCKKLPKIFIPKTVSGDWPISHNIRVEPGFYTPIINQHGAVSVQTAHGFLGIKPGEFEWVSPYGQPGDRLWVRETWRPNPAIPGEGIWYRADWHPQGEIAKDKGWKPSIHMPRWASRITLEIVSVRVERLKDLSETDARAEGIEKATKDGDLWKFGYDGLPWAEWWSTAVGAFGNLWATINGQQSWDANPWVWVIEFKRVDA